MSNTKKTASERQFQEDVAQRLRRYRWELSEELDGNRHKVTVQTLIDNWRQELCRINADQLEGVALTDNEFAQVMVAVGRLGNSYEAAKLLAMENSTGKIDGIYRDELPGVTRRQITLTIFKKAEVRGGDSRYQLAREVQTEKNRFDMVLLVNGLPLINIELKRADVSLDEAFAQFRRYYQDGEFIHNFMAFSQMMVIMSPIEMRYFATPKSAQDFNPAFAFHWANRKNEPMNKWEDVVDNFLMVPMAHQMVGDYLVIHEAENAEERRHMLMRPYQVYALQAVELAAFGLDVESRIPHGGYVWHTTGSGKTITSFKTALFLATRAGFDKIVFMVDRRELDANTSLRFKEYAAYEPVQVDDTACTAQLEKSLKRPGIVVTTTFKVNVLVKQLKERGDYRLQDKRIVFIVDEAHRTTMGHMMAGIKEFFRSNGLFYGFTGTPLFDENHARGLVNEKSEAIKTTEKLFGNELHSYTIDQAIADRNVLGFHVKYLNTGECKGYDDLREQLVKAIQAEPGQAAEPADIEERVWSWTELKVEQEAEKRGVLRYQDETHIPRVVERILSGWEAQSQARKFNAILTVAYKSRVLAYYEEFKKQLSGMERPLNVAMTVSFGNPNDPDRLPREFVAEMFRDYQAYTGIECVAGDKRRGEDAYYADLTERGKRGGSGRNEHNIDLIIVADQMLTGYDAKYMNTLYNDRQLELQGLIQAYSRTNRVLGPDKEFGTIINFLRPRQSEAAVNEALRLYGSGGENSEVIVDTYAVAAAKLKSAFAKVKAQLLEPADWKLLEAKEKQKFLEAFRKAARQLSRVEQYYEYEWDEDSFGMADGLWLKYVGAYKNLTRKDKDALTVPIAPLPGHVKVVGMQDITATYIISLVGEKTKVVDGVRVIDEESLRLILEKIQELEGLGEKQEADVLRAFLTDMQAGHVPAASNADEAFTNWKHGAFEQALATFAQEWGIDKEILRSAVAAYDTAKPQTIPRLDEIRSSLDYAAATVKHGEDRMDHVFELEDKLPEWVAESRASYLS